jgi:hypothetical protein
MRNRLFVILMAPLFAAAIAAAQTQGSSTESTSQASNPPVTATADTNVTAPATASTPQAKKVWTNEDVPTLRGGDPISTFKGNNTKPASAKPVAGTKNGKMFQAQIARLEGQIPPLDAQIAELQSAIDGKPTGDGKTSQRPRGVKADDWGVEMQELQKKRQDILDHITALQDEARHQGVAPNTLP